MSENKKETSSTGIVITRKNKIIIDAKPDKIFINSKIKSTRTPLQPIDESSTKSDKKVKQEKNSIQNIEVSEVPSHKAKTAIFVLSIIGLVMLIMLAICHAIEVNLEEYSSGMKTSGIIVMSMLVAIAIILIPIFIIFLIASIKQFKIPKTKGFTDRVPALVNILISVLTLICSGLLVLIFAEFIIVQQNQFQSVWSFRLSSITGLTGFVIAYLMSYKLTFGNETMVTKRHINIFHQQIKILIIVLGFIAFAFGVVWSVFSMKHETEWTIAAFYFGNAVVTPIAFIIVAIAANIALSIVYGRKSVKGLIADVVPSGIFLILLIIFTIMGGKYTENSKPQYIEGTPTTMLLVDYVFATIFAIYMIVWTKVRKQAFYNLPNASELAVIKKETKSEKVKDEK